MRLGAQRGAQALLGSDRLLLRGSVSRSYYAAYCAVTCCLVRRGIVFANGSSNPPHAELPGYVGNIGGLTEDQRRSIRRALRRLWKARVDADYIPAAVIDSAIARDALRDALRVMRLLGVEDDGT